MEDLRLAQIAHLPYHQQRDIVFDDIAVAIRRALEVLRPDDVTVEGLTKGLLLGRTPMPAPPMPPPRLTSVDGGGKPDRRRTRRPKLTPVPGGAA